MTAESTEFSLHQQIKELQRELQMRNMVYPKRIQRSLLGKKDAERQIGALKAAIATLEGVKEHGLDPAPEPLVIEADIPLPTIRVARDKLAFLYQGLRELQKIEGMPDDLKSMITMTGSQITVMGMYLKQKQDVEEEKEKAA